MDVEFADTNYLKFQIVAIAVFFVICILFAWLWPLLSKTIKRGVRTSLEFDERECKLIQNEPCWNLRQDQPDYFFSSQVSTTSLRPEIADIMDQFEVDPIKGEYLMLISWFQH